MWTGEEKKKIYARTAVRAETSLVVLPPPPPHSTGRWYGGRAENPAPKHEKKAVKTMNLSAKLGALGRSSQNFKTVVREGIATNSRVCMLVSYSLVAHLFVSRVCLVYTNSFLAHLRLFFK